jgi:hypothetical protein
MCSLRVLPNTGTTRQPPFYINSASWGIVKSNQQSILNYPVSFSTPPSTVNSQQSTVNNNSGATGIDITDSDGTRRCWGKEPFTIAGMAHNRSGWEKFCCIWNALIGSSAKCSGWSSASVSDRRSVSSASFVQITRYSQCEPWWSQEKEVDEWYKFGKLEN